MLLKSFNNYLANQKLSMEAQEEEWQPITYSLIALKLWKQTVTEQVIFMDYKL